MIVLLYFSCNSGVVVEGGEYQRLPTLSSSPEILKSSQTSFTFRFGENCT